LFLILLFTIIHSLTDKLNTKLIKQPESKIKNLVDLFLTLLIKLVILTYLILSPKTTSKKTFKKELHASQFNGPIAQPEKT